METEFDLTKLTLSQGMKQQVWTKLGNDTTGVGGSVGHCCGVRVDVAICRKVIVWNLVWLLLRRLYVVGRPFPR
jgi:hypothetical protein